MKKKSTTDERESFSNQTLQQKSHQNDKHLGCLSSKIFGTILKQTRKERMD